MDTRERKNLGKATEIRNSLLSTKPMDHFQFQRIGYFCTDKDSTPNHLIFNRTVSLKDTWSKVKDKA